MKRFVSIMMVIVLAIGSIQICSGISSAAIKLGVVPKEAICYAEEVFESFKKESEGFILGGSEDFIINNEFKLETPFVIYENDCETQDEIYYFPICDSKNTLVYMLSVMGTSHGWNHCLSTEWIGEINDSYTSGITDEFFRVHNELISENAVSNKIKEKIYSNSDGVLNKRKELERRFVKTDIDEIKRIKDVEAKYNPSYQVDSNNYKKCHLHNKKSNNDHGMCWASSVATICNYRRGTNIDPLNVCGLMGVDPDVGAFNDVAQDALEQCGVKYPCDVVVQMTYKRIKQNIQLKYPIYVYGKAKKGLAHAVTVYGYLYDGKVEHFFVWDPMRKGREYKAKYNKYGSSITDDNKTYIWDSSLSMV